ncbi:hypothetical protein ARMGADRAFT_108395 [Armillaria gallica]|uniref:MYND-type domain-containing protein n=1 Tax=Armillaria gallica TaxID=47427 RepID=A0A2H3DQW5_ARMGA|nr:hypothetical protein ARMGADRAFT_108395 [Armillaria gallica]
MSTTPNVAPKAKDSDFLIKSSSLINKRCHTCQKTPQQLGVDRPFQVCSRCKEVMYCSRKCQRENWSVHKIPCARSKEKAIIFGNDPIRAARAARFVKWYEAIPKLDVFRQAALQALDIVNHPENVDRKALRLRLKLHPEYKQREPVDRYVLVEGLMLPKETLYGCRPLDRQFLTEYIQAQNDVVKGRGQLGVVPVSISEVDDNGSIMNSSWWILALPFTHEEAKGILQATKWDDVHWEARLRDILATPEAEWIRVVPIPNTKGQFHFGLPENLLKEYPFGCLGRRISEMRLNEPRSQFAWNINDGLSRTSERMAARGGNNQGWSR